MKKQLFAAVEKVCPCIDKSGHRYIEMTLRAERSFTLPGPVPDMSDWF